MAAEKLYALTRECAPGEQTGAAGVRHQACVESNQVILRLATLRQVEENEQVAPECWGCGGWLFERPLTPAETEDLRRRQAGWGD
jgi:hypothetical protein